MGIFKRVLFLAMVLLLAFSVSLSSVAFATPRVADGSIIYFPYINGRRTVNVLPEFVERYGGTFTIFACPNGDYVIGFYDIFSTRTQWFNEWGVSLGGLFVGSERAFHDLVQLSKDMMFNVHSVPASWTAEDIVRRNIAALRSELNIPENDDVVIWMDNNQNEPSTNERGYIIIQTDNNNNEPQVYGRRYIDIPTENVRHYGREGNNHVYATPVVLQSLPSAWAFEHVVEAIGVGLVPGDLQHYYTQPTTRAEFAALAVTLYETVTGTTITGRASFSDTTDISVQKAGYLGVVQGVGEGNFAPNNTLTREQAAVMLVRLADVIGQPLSLSAPTFVDNAQLSSWATDAVGQMQASGIMGGVGENQFAPNGDYTREQSIVTILRLFEILN